MCNCWFPAAYIDSHFLAFCGVPANRTLNDAAIYFDNAFDNAKITSGNRMLLDLLCNFLMCIVILSDNQRTCRVHINAVDNSRTDFTVNSGKAVFAVVHHCVD